MESVETDDQSIDELMTIQFADDSADYRGILLRNELPQSRGPNGL